MARPKLITETIYNLEFELAKHKAVFAAFPEAKVNIYGEYQSKEVNKIYSKFDFERSGWGVYVLPYCEVSFTHDNKTSIAKIYSKPKRSRLVYLSYDPATQKNIIKFSRLSFNLKQNHFKDDMLNTCRIEIMDFIKLNSKFAMDSKHLEPRLKKLIIFS